MAKSQEKSKLFDFLLTFGHFWWLLLTSFFTEDEWCSGEKDPSRWWIHVSNLSKHAAEQWLAFPIIWRGSSLPLYKLPIEPAQMTSHLAFLCGTFSRGGPMHQGLVHSDDVLRELGYNWVGKFLWTSLPDVAVRGRRDGSCIAKDVDQDPSLSPVSMNLRLCVGVPLDMANHLMQHHKPHHPLDSLSSSSKHHKFDTGLPLYQPSAIHGWWTWSSYVTHRFN